MLTSRLSNEEAQGSLETRKLFANAKTRCRLAYESNTLPYSLHFSMRVVKLNHGVAKQASETITTGD